MDGVGWVGVDMAAVGFGLVLIELLLIVLRFQRLTKRVEELNLLLENGIRLSNDEIRILRESTSQTAALLRPYHRIARRLRHPLVLALLASYRRGRRRTG